MTHDLLQQLLTEDQTAAYLSIRSQTLATWRATRRYALPYIRVGRAIRYRLTDVEQFLTRRTVSCGAAGTAPAASGSLRDGSGSAH